MGSLRFLKNFHFIYVYVSERVCACESEGGPNFSVKSRRENSRAAGCEKCFTLRRRKIEWRNRRCVYL